MTIFNMTLGPNGIADMLARLPKFGPAAPPKHVFNYHIRTTDELLKFPQARKLDVPFTSRERAIRALQDADVNRTFRFMDLPPELRLHVYSFLLTLKAVPNMMGPGQMGTAPTADTAILRTGKQVYAEARDVLYGENAFVVTLAVDRAPHQPGGYQLMWDVCGLRPREWDGMYMMGMSEPTSLLTQSVDWPHYLRLAEKVTVKIDLPYPPPTALVKATSTALTAANRALYDLACFLLASSAAREINFDISCEADRFIAHKDLADVLSPIRLFPAHKTFAIRHLAPSIADAIKTPVGGGDLHATGPHTIMHVFRSIMGEVVLLGELGMLDTPASLELSTRLAEALDRGCTALGVESEINTPATHRQLLDIVRELDAKLSEVEVSGTFDGDVGMIEEVRELREVRKALAR